MVLFLGVIWKNKTLLKVQFLGWNVACDAVLAHDICRRKRSSWVCSTAEETMNHLFFHYEAANYIWSMLCSLFVIQRVVPDTLKTCLEIWFGSESVMISENVGDLGCSIPLQQFLVELERG